MARQRSSLLHASQPMGAIMVNHTAKPYPAWAVTALQAFKGKVRKYRAQQRKRHPTTPLTNAALALAGQSKARQGLGYTRNAQPTSWV